MFDDEGNALFADAYAQYCLSTAAAVHGKSVSAFIAYCTIGAGAPKLTRRDRGLPMLPEVRKLMELLAMWGKTTGLFNQLVRGLNQYDPPPLDLVTANQRELGQLMIRTRKYLERFW